jgi:multidrug efflux pump subunit AcrB
MVILLITGFMFAITMVREMFPESRPDEIIISVVYPATQPEELEKAVTIKIEEQVRDIEGIEKVTSNVREGLSTTTLTLYNEVDDIDAVLQAVKIEVDAIEDFPEDMENPIIRKMEPVLPVIQIALYGDGTEADRKQAARDLRDEILRLPGVSDVELGGVRNDEISIEIDPEKLWKFNITFQEVADAVRKTNRDISGGNLKGDTSTISVKTMGEQLYGKDLEAIVIRSDNEGRDIRVKDITTVIDGYVDVDVESYFNGKPSITLVIQKTKTQDAIRIANLVTAFIKGKQSAAYDPFGFEAAQNATGFSYYSSNVSAYTNWMISKLAGEPDFIKTYRESQAAPFKHTFKVALYSDLSRFIRGRLDLMVRNGQSGLILVLIALNLFLNWRVAFWVSMGMPVSFLGGFILMWMFGVTLNLLSMFGLIIVLGIIVDDAIVIGENIYSKIEGGMNSHDAAIIGAEEVMWPVIASVTTNIASFMPLLFISGRIGDFMRELPIVVTATLLVSLMEAIIILPSHLAHLPVPRNKNAPITSTGWIGRLKRSQRWVGSLYQIYFINAIYMRLTRLALGWRYVTVSIAMMLLLCSFGLFLGGFVESVFIQKMDSETLVAELEMPVGTVIDETRSRLMKLSEYTMKIPEVNHVQTQVGLRLNLGGAGSAGAETQSHLGQLIIELQESDVRDSKGLRSSEEILAELRHYSESLKGINSLTWDAMSGGPAGKDIEIRVSGENFDNLVLASTQIKTDLNKFDGVVDLKDNYESGKREVQFKLKETARAMGITESDLGVFIRNALYGAEARRMTRNREDVKIMVRYPREYRKNIFNLEQMWVPIPGATGGFSAMAVTPQNADSPTSSSGRWSPVSELAFWEETRSFTTIYRSQQQRSITVSANVDYARNNLDNIMDQFKQTTTRDLMLKYPESRIEFLGTSEERTKSFSGLFKALPIALLLIYMVLAGLFKSYWQPLVVMMAIPFGLQGAIVGHWLTDNPMTILSWIGMVALTGILVNDSLVMIDFVNSQIKSGIKVFDAHLNATKLRLRAIMLTTLTTVSGLLPLLFEKSFQAKFLIPMAVTISFGLMFATMMTLFVVPSINLICYDLGHFMKYLWSGNKADLSVESDHNQ